MIGCDFVIRLDRLRT